MDEERSVSVDIVLDIGSGVTAISKALLKGVQVEMPGMQLTRTFEGKTRVVTQQQVRNKMWKSKPV